jgi:putative peptide maturation dehydrogenase
MPRIRRTAYVLFHCQDESLPDFALLLRGVASLVRRPQLYAISVLTGEEHPITKEQLELVCSLPSDRWVDGDSLDRETVRELARKGVLLSDEEDEELAALRTRDEQLASTGWNLYGALYHFMTKWSGVDLGTGAEGELGAITEEAVAGFVAAQGPPPEPFHELERPLAVRELPLVRPVGGLYQALAERKTTRGFDPDRPLSVEELAIVLDQVWGCHGTAAIRDDLVLLKKTSPSGGGLHPIEAYPLVTNVDGIEPGLYHYRSRDHALELVSELGAEEARALATRFMTGQWFLGSAQVSFVMTARFVRSHWKYRKHQKAYTALLMDAAHLSQVLYLVAADLGLGAFVTAAINAGDIEASLGLDGVSEGVLAVAGCGVGLPQAPLELQFTPYVPRETRLWNTVSRAPGRSG